jgi:hypothetical protein
VRDFRSGAYTYIDDFKLMMVIAFLSAPLLLLLRKPRGAHASSAAAAE